MKKYFQAIVIIIIVTFSLLSCEEENDIPIEPCELHNTYELEITNNSDYRIIDFVVWTWNEAPPFYWDEINQFGTETDFTEPKMDFNKLVLDIFPNETIILKDLPVGYSIYGYSVADNVFIWQYLDRFLTESCEEYTIKITDTTTVPVDTTFVDTTDYEQLKLDSIVNSLGDEWFIDSILIQITHDADSIKYLNDIVDIDEVYIMDFIITWYYNDWWWSETYQGWGYPTGRYHRFEYEEVKYFKYERDMVYYLKPAFPLGAPDILMVYPAAPIDTRISEKYLQLKLSDYVNIY
jgi:hypothetical protein